MAKGIHKLAEIVRYRELLYNLVITELKLRYRRSVLGFFWSMLNPLLMMIVLTLVFSTIMRFNIKDYAVLLIAGLLPWIFFSQAVNLSLMSIVAKSDLLKKVYIPKALIPLAAVLSSLINFLLALVPLFILVTVLGHPPTLATLFIPVAILFATLFTCAAAFLFSCLNVFFRDFGHMTEVLLQAWFYLSPVIYRVDMVPERFRPLFSWNPLTHIVECFRAPIYDGTLPANGTILWAAVTSITALFIALAVFFRFERHFIFRV